MFSKPLVRGHVLTRLLKFNSLNAYSWLKEAARVLTMDLAVGFSLLLFQSGSSAAPPVFHRQYSLVNASPFSVEGGNRVLFFLLQTVLVYSKRAN